MTENNASTSSFAETDLGPNPRREPMPVITTARTERPRPARYADRAATAGVAAVSAALLMTELALTRIFSVTMYYHFAFLAISIALFGLSASGVAVYLLRRRLAAIDTRVLLAVVSTAHAFATLAALACLVRIRVGLNYSAENLGADARHLYTRGASLLHRWRRDVGRFLADDRSHQCAVRG
jgi:hypothetical protein